MYVIHKHRLLPGINTLYVPDEAQLLSVAFQHDDLFVWERHAVDQASDRGRAVLVVPTGVEHDEPLFAPFFATAHHPSGQLVLHVFALERAIGPVTNH